MCSVGTQGCGNNGHASGSYPDYPQGGRVAMVTLVAASGQRDAAHRRHWSATSR